MSKYHEDKELASSGGTECDHSNALFPVRTAFHLPKLTNSSRRLMKPSAANGVEASAC